MENTKHLFPQRMMESLTICQFGWDKYNLVIFYWSFLLHGLNSNFKEVKEKKKILTGCGGGGGGGSLITCGQITDKT